MTVGFEFVKEVFERVYQQVLLEKGQDYMESLPTGYLVDSAGDLTFIKSLGKGLYGLPIDDVVPDDGELPIAWLFDSMGLGLVQINVSVSEYELKELAKKHYKL